MFHKLSEFHVLEEVILEVLLASTKEHISKIKKTRQKIFGLMSGTFAGSCGPSCLVHAIGLVWQPCLSFCWNFLHNAPYSRSYILTVAEVVVEGSFRYVKAGKLQHLFPWFGQDRICSCGWFLLCVVFGSVDSTSWRGRGGKKMQ